MTISNIRIKNFRSLADAQIDAKNLTIFVGSNDEGKSNILRALDLFFNESHGGYDFLWEKDYSGYAKKIKQKAPQIEISITFDIPSTFNVDQPVVWKKFWRQYGFFDESIALEDGGDLPPRSKIFAFLKAIRYEYVPAIKGPEYFERLLGSIHDMLDATVREEIRSAADDFTVEIRRHTQRILSDLEQKIGIKSDLELPTDLKRLFTDLEFRSSVGENRVALNQRGDGVKVRHIPIILNWLAEQANHLSAPGKPRVVTIWGYEEPENNLEIRRCFELTEYFLENSKKIQTLLTTHSPVFYSAFHKHEGDNVQLMEVRLKKDEGTQVLPRSIRLADDIDALHSSVGFLELLEPHVVHWKETVDRLQDRINEGVSTDAPTIFVEGPTDQIIINAIIKKEFPYAKHVHVCCSQRNGGGHAWVKDSLIAWHHARSEVLAVGLFDADDGSSQSIREFVEVVESKTGGKSKAKKHVLKADGLSLEIRKAEVEVPIAIEELCPQELWLFAKDQGWLESRRNIPLLYNFQLLDISVNQWLKEKLPDETLNLIANKCVAKKHKEKFAAEVVLQINDKKSELEFAPLIKLVGTLLKIIDVKNPA